jgi:uncharacterized protein YndB with AHSA1/START domain
MAAKKESLTEGTFDREIVITRVYDAPRETVWDAWTDPQQVVQWWGPNGFTTTIHEMDVRPGGFWRLTMHGPDGTDYPNKSMFLEVVKPERIVYSHGGGRKGDPGAQFEATWTFEAQEGKTKLTLRMVFATAAARELIVKTYNAIEGGNQTLGRLAETLARTPVIIERTFDAPVSVVWKALTNLDDMKQWWPHLASLEAFEPEVGFAAQFSIHHDGKDFLHIWEVTEVAPERKLSYSWKFAGNPGDSTVTYELFPEGNKTRLKLTHGGLESFLPESNPHLARGNFLMGWTSLGATLQQFLEKRDGRVHEDFVISRVFDAPLDLVWKAFTDPSHMKNWWGPKGFTVRFAKMDFRPGGSYHYCMRSPDGQDMWGKFVYREIIAPQRIVFLNSFSDEKGGLTRHPMSPTWPLEMLSTFTFTEQTGKTTLTIRWSPFNATDAERKTFDDGRNGMNQGWGGTLDQLEAYLAEVKS